MRSHLTGVGKGVAVVIAFLAPGELLCAALVANARYIACFQIIMIGMTLGGFFATRIQTVAPVLNGCLSVLAAYVVYTVYLLAFDGVLHDVHVPSLAPVTLFLLTPGLSAVFLARAVFARHWKDF